MKTTHSKKTVDFNVKLSENEKDMLSNLAKDRNATMSEIIRQTITWQFRMRFANEPRCTSGGNCLCPNMHTLQNPDKPSDSAILDALANPNGTL